MPRIICRGIPFEGLCQISGKLTAELAEICECGTDNSTIEFINAVTVMDGVQAGHYPFIEVAWFDRGAEVRNRMARSITEHVLSLGLKEIEIAFTVYEKQSYYINGVPC